MPPVEQSAAVPDRATATQIQKQQLDAIGSHTFHIWSIYALIVVVLAAGICALVLPNIFWENSYLRADVRYLPQLLLGFIALIVLFNFDFGSAWPVLLVVLGAGMLLRGTGADSAGSPSEVHS